MIRDNFAETNNKQLGESEDILDGIRVTVDLGSRVTLPQAQNTSFLLCFYACNSVTVFSEGIRTLFGRGSQNILREVRERMLGLHWFGCVTLLQLSQSLSLTLYLLSTYVIYSLVTVISNSMVL